MNKGLNDTRGLGFDLGRCIIVVRTKRKNVGAKTFEDCLLLHLIHELVYISIRFFGTVTKQLASAEE